MNFELKLQKIGDSVGVILPEEALARMEVAEGDSLWVTARPDGSLELRPSGAEFVRQMEGAGGIVGRYRNALGDLAK